MNDLNMTGEVAATLKQGKRAVSKGPSQWAIQPLREVRLPESLAECATPDAAAAYWRNNVATAPGFNPEVENFVVLILNTRKRIKGHVHVSMGTMDTLLVHPREVFRAAIVAGAACIVMMHNHPSGDATPSEADVKITRDLNRAGQLLKIEAVDHVVIGAGSNRCSLREMGYFYN